MFDDLDIETFIERYRPELVQAGDILTLREGTNGPNGHRVRVVATDRGVVWEQGGVTLLLNGTRLV